MREHPIPQDLTGYRFHIIGNMTLKQFTEVAVGVVIGVILYNTNLVAVVKWPLILISAGMGALIAWVPFEERPLDHWFTTFFTTLYRPTKFFWRKKNTIPAPFLFKPRPDQVNVAEEVNLLPARQARTKEYITTVELTQPKDAWEVEEDQRVTALLGHFDTVEVPTISITKTAHKPELSVRVRELQDITHPTPEVVSQLVAEPISMAMDEVATPVVAAPAVVAPIITAPVVATPTTITPASTPIPIKFTPQVTQLDVATETTPILEPEPVLFQPASSPPTPIQPPQLLPDEEITTNASLPFPSVPTQPNKLVGMVLDTNQKILTNTIVEIKNLQGLVARAVKTNALGQFFITTPLENGSYIITADKPGYQFSSQQLVLAGQIIPPLQITAVGNGA